MTRAGQDAAAREVVRGWFSGREDLFEAVETVVADEGPGWWATALAPAPPADGRARRRRSDARLGCQDGFEVAQAAVEVGWRLLSAWSGSAGERDECASPERRVAVLKAMALLAEIEVEAKYRGPA